MTTFTRFYKKSKLIVISMKDIEKILFEESKKKEIAEYVFERLYTRFLKIFDFKCNQRKTYNKFGKDSNKKIFNEEFKNGFLQMASCSLLIETFSAFLTGENETPPYQGKNRFKNVFEYAKEHKNPLKLFINEPFYSKIRCGLLHQGETKGKYLITREGINLLKDEKIDAYLFHKYLTELLKTYKNELEKDENWEMEIWANCRLKISHIIRNSR